MTPATAYPEIFGPKGLWPSAGSASQPRTAEDLAERIAAAQRRAEESFAREQARREAALSTAEADGTSADGAGGPPSTSAEADEVP